MQRSTRISNPAAPRLSLAAARELAERIRRGRMRARPRAVRSRDTALRARALRDSAEYY